MNWLSIFGRRHRVSRGASMVPFPARELANALAADRRWLEPMDFVIATLDHGSYPKNITLAIIRSYLSESVHLSFEGYPDDKVSSLFGPLFALGFNPSEHNVGYFAEWKEGDEGMKQIESAIKVLETHLRFRNCGSLMATGPEHFSETMGAVGDFYEVENGTYILIKHPS